MSRFTATVLISMLMLVFSVQAGELSVSSNLTQPELSFLQGYHHFTSAPGPLYAPPGSPELPHVGHQLLLPPGEEIYSVKIESEAWLPMMGQIHLWPAQKPVPYCKTGEQPFTEPDPSVYTSDEIYPASPVEAFRTDFMNGHGVGSITVSTARYRPASGQLEVLVSYELVVETKPTSRAQEALNLMLKQTPGVIERVSQSVENPEALSAYGSPDGVDQANVRYLIVTAAEFEPIFQSLAEHRTNRGLQAEIILVEDIAVQYSGIDLADQIRNCVIDYYQNQGLEYVLLGGDTEYVPDRGLYAMVGDEIDEDIPADLYFSNLDGNWNDDGDNRWGEPSEVDFYSEVAIGRIPADSESEAQNLINKTIQYENAPVVADLENGLMAGEDLGWLVWGGEIKDEIRLGSTNWGYTTAGFPGNFSVGTLYDMYGTWSAMSDLLPLLNSGPHLVNHMGHANNTYVMKFYAGQVNDNNMTNNGINHNFYILYSQGCYAGAFDNRTPSGSYTSDAIAENFTIIQHGAVAFLANSRYGWGSYNNTNGPSQYFDRQFFDALFAEDNYRTIGWINADSKHDNVPFIGGATLWCYYQVNLLGDPAVDVWTGTPLTLTPSYPDTVLLGTTQIQVDVGEPDAYIALVRDGEVIGTGLSNASGIGNVFTSDPINVPGTLTLSITGHDYLPYTGAIEAVTAEGPYVIMTDPNFDDSIGGNGDGNADLGETLYISAVFQNVGVDPATGLTATLTCSDCCVDITQGSTPLGNLGIGESTQVSNAFEVTLLPNVQDGQELQFLVTVEDDQGYTWTSDYAITAFAPELVLLSYSINDGNDGHLMPGESATLEIEICNTGSGGTTDLSIWLSSDNPAATVTIPSSSLPALQSSAAGTADALEFALDATIADPSTLVLYIAATDTRNYQDNFLIEVPVGGIFDDMESGAGDWTHQSITSGWFDQWNWAQILNHTQGGSSAWYCGDNGQYGELLDAGLITPVYPVYGQHELRFYHWMSAQLASGSPGYAYDGGIVEMSLNGGAFEQITPESGYPNLFSYSGYPLPVPVNTPCYSGQIIWEYAVFSIEGEGTVQFRFRFLSDGSTNSIGWFIDDLELIKVSNLNPPSNLNASLLGAEVTLTWNTPDPGGLDGKGAAGTRQPQSLERYRIYRDGAWIDSTEALSYVDNLGNLPSGAYYYQVSGIFDGVEGPLCEPVTVDYVGVEPVNSLSLPTETALRAAYPNPFNPVINLRFDVASPGLVNLRVYDLMGRSVATIFSAYANAGTHEVTWEAGGFASGLYIVEMTIGSYTGLQKVLLLK